MFHCLSVNPTSSTIVSPTTDIQSELNDDCTTDVHYDDGNDDSLDNINLIGEQPQTESESDRYNFHRDINPPPGVKFGIHLEHVLASYHGIDLKLFDEIVDLIQYHATAKDIDFRTTKLYPRKELTNTQSTLYNL